MRIRTSVEAFMTTTKKEHKTRKTQHTFEERSVDGLQTISRTGIHTHIQLRHGIQTLNVLGELGVGHHEATNLPGMQG